MRLRTKIMMIALLPVFILGVGLFILAANRTADGIYDEAYEGMQAVALAVRDIFEVGNQGSYYLDEGGNLWKGESLNISHAEEIVDHIKDKTGIDVTIFWGDTRVLTSIKSEMGEQKIGTKASDLVVQKVLKEGKYYLDRDTEILGKEYVVCYVPFYQDETSGEPVGMVFVGKPRESVAKIVAKIQLQILFVILAVLLVTGVVVTALIRHIMGGLGKSMELLRRISEGDLTVEVDKSLLGRSDEIGLLGREIQKLCREFQTIVNVLVDKSTQLDLGSEALRKRSGNILQVMKGLDQSSQEMSISCVSQAEDASTVGSDVTQMGEMIGNSNGEVRKMYDISKQIQAMSEQMSEELLELNKDMGQVRKSIDYLGQQTVLTKESVDKIGNATELIAAVASQTSLLSLNASIEAARAGDLGRGFGVVASEIQNLSVQANHAVEDIRTMVEALTGNSNNTVKRMEEVQRVIKSQETTIEKTGEVFDSVRNGIKESVSHMDRIIGRAGKMEDVRIDMVETVQNSAALAQENAASIEEMLASIETVYGEVQMLSEEMNHLGELSSQMQESVELFQF